MAPSQASKRLRADTEDGDSRNRRGKRPRHSLSPSSDDDPSSENEPEMSEADAPEEDGDKEADELDLAYTQRIEMQLRNTEAKQNIPNECGIIQEISCTNFMCHEQLRVPLGPLINFIIGHNGSGKSAVLTALTLCLGGKAAATNRGQNLKSFIKEGRDHCSIRVKIKNEGSAAYRADLYGKSITVERHFTRAGTSGFKLKDENDRLVSIKKSDLEDIIDAFALQIDNPMNVLTQDNARQFLNDSSPKEKYKFFLKGTQLQALKEDYVLMESQLEEMQDKCLTLEADVGVLKSQFQEALAKAQRAHNLEQMAVREKLLAHQMAWAEVEVQEKALEELEEGLAQIGQTEEERRNTAEYHSQQFETANQAFSEINQAIQDKQAELQPKEQELSDIDEKWKETKAAIFNVRAQQRDTIGKIQSKEKSIQRYQDQIQDHRQRQAEADGGQHAQKLAELEEARQEVKSARDELTELDSKVQELENDLQTARNRKIEQEERTREKHEEVARMRNTIRELQQGQRNWMDCYPNPANLPKLLNAIQNERRFREPPVGPMGRHVKLLKPEWSSILETSFGASLNAFVVKSQSDQSILSELMRRMNCQYPIFIGQDGHIDTTAHEPDPKLDTWMRVLAIDNNLVRNQLIINHGIEQVVLIPRKKEAEDLMHGPPSGRRNVRMCYFMAETDPTKGHVINVNQNSGAISLGPINPYRRKARMQADKEPQLRAARSNLDRLQRDLDAAVAEAKERQRHVESCERKLEEHGRLRRELVVRSQKAETIVEQLDLELSAAAPDSGMLEQLDESLREAEEEKAFEEGQMEDIIAEKRKLDEISREQKDSKAAMQGVIDQLRIELDKLERNAERLRHAREQALREKNAALDSVAAAERRRGEFEEKRVAKLRHLQDITSQAEQICARVAVPTGETFDSLNRKRERLARERVQSERELGGSRQDLLAAASAAKERYQKAEASLKKIGQLKQALNQALKSRRDRWMRFREDISRRAQTTFSYLLSDRQFRGKLKVDHKAQLLDIKVQPDITVANPAGRQTKTLSGGEKSFSTICLLLSLWDAMGSPIRCLDEFDVFMDSVNRDISMRMMISAARRAVGRQYILITPQAMNSIQSVGDVKIIKMRDPERGQTALNISR